MCFGLAWFMVLRLLKVFWACLGFGVLGVLVSGSGSVYPSPLGSRGSAQGIPDVSNL